MDDSDEVGSGDPSVGRRPPLKHSGGGGQDGSGGYDESSPVPPPALAAQAYLAAERKAGETTMRAVLQRVRRARVAVGDEVTGEIGTGLLVLLGVTHADTAAGAAWLAEKVVNLRLFADAEGKMNLSVQDVGGA